MGSGDGAGDGSGVGSAVGRREGSKVVGDAVVGLSVGMSLIVGGYLRKRRALQKTSHREFPRVPATYQPSLQRTYREFPRGVA